MTEQSAPTSEQTKADQVDGQRMVRMVIALAVAMGLGVGLCLLLMPDDPPQFDRVIRPKGMAEARRWPGILIRDSVEVGGHAGAHFVVGLHSERIGDGVVVSTDRWKDQTLVDAQGEAVDIVIVVVGDFRSAAPTEKQIKALVSLVDDLATLFRIPLTAIRGPWDDADSETTFPTAGFLRRLGSALQK
jgi:hypothetical protein